MMSSSPIHGTFGDGSILHNHQQANAAMMQEVLHCNDITSIYAEIMAVCQPFYELPKGANTTKFSIPPRLEDGLFMGNMGSENEEEDNPQDPTSSRFSNHHTCDSCLQTPPPSTSRASDDQ